MNRKATWSPAAEEDLRLILDYLQSKWSQHVVNKFINRIDDNIGLIMEDPKIFPVINAELQIRKSVITKQNTLYYRVVSDGVEIARLFDSRQDPKKLKF
ncbi:type II toxin-antitoxin system RelE/ParE family toxin [Plebeiibacterium marinum]|uniref:Type II toxin-antitoxin system RelE/ParE family toxin n=1 Tax=Plebeiibacterium marinum TaxID=2992111 RepID=A0AAE3SM19_9BACT|nr:type II toxin-antitoxin system RelE/ParE family toxin [Plebeiobacterium marinum]MCW3808029.1 type II toxin-antitoxin system RelE/ParE family toxin [Plebeiobacterium marinum]